MLPYASIMSTSSRFRCLGAPNASVLAKFFNQRFGIPAAIGCDHCIWLFASESPDLPENLWLSINPGPTRLEKLSETRWMKNHRSQSEWEPGPQDWVPPFHPFPSFFHHQIQKHPRVGLRLCQTTGQIWSGYAAAWWSERSAWLLDGQATSSHIRTTTGPKFYNSWCKTW